MASSKTLIRTGVSLINRFVNPTVNSNPIPLHRILCQSPPLMNPPQLFPSVFLPQSHTSFLQFPQNQNDAESRRELFLHPSGIPFLPFFLPEGLSHFPIYIYTYWMYCSYSCTCMFGIIYRYRCLWVEILGFSELIDIISTFTFWPSYGEF